MLDLADLFPGFASKWVDTTAGRIFARTIPAETDDPRRDLARMGSSTCRVSPSTAGIISLKRRPRRPRKR